MISPERGLLYEPVLSRSFFARMESDTIKCQVGINFVRKAYHSSRYVPKVKVNARKGEVIAQRNVLHCWFTSQSILL